LTCGVARQRVGTGPFPPRLRRAAPVARRPSTTLAAGPAPARSAPGGVR